MKCVIYARVSSKEQEKEGYSIPAQLKLLREYANSKRIEIAKEFIDVETAKSAGRKGFGEMLSYLKATLDCKLILVEKTDRLYRNLKDWVTIDELDLQIFFVKENKMVSKDSRSSDKLMHGIQVLMAKNYIDNLSEEVKKGMKQKADQGEWPQKAPLGYLNDKVNKRISVDVKKSVFVVEMFRLYATRKYSLNQLRLEMFRKGLVSKTGKPMAKSMIETILKNPFYYGHFYWNGQMYEGIHEAIIDKQLFEQTQMVLKSGGHPRPSDHDFAFKGLLKCANCGCAIVGEIKKGKYIYYHCTSARGKCTQPYLREEVLAESLASTLRAIQVTPKMSEDILSALKNFHHQEGDFREREVKRLRMKQDELQHRINKCYEDRLDGVINEAYWRDLSTRWRQEQDQVVQSLDRLKEANRNYLDTASEILELSQNAISLYEKQNAKEKRRLLDCVLSNCTLNGVTVCPTYKTPFNFIAEGVDLTVKLPRQDSNLRPAD